ncbi:putative F-box protein [Rosa sericea]
MDLDCTRKRRSSPPIWSKLPPELLGFITTKLGSVDTIRFKVVCPSWNRAAKSYISSPCYKVMEQTPLLMIPSQEKKDLHTRRFFSLAKNNTFTLKNVFRDFPEAWCVGSSHGWLVLMDGTGKLDLFNPFTEDRIELPSLWTLPHFAKIKTLSDEFARNTNLLKGYMMGKAVTSCNPSCNKDFAVVITHSLRGRLAFCKHGNNRCTWTDLGDESDHYSDIIFHNGHLYTLTSGGSVGVWDMTKSFPTKIFYLRPFADQSEINKDFPFAKFDVQHYLVESSGDLLFVWRFIVKTIEGETFPYRTLHFHIFRLSSTSKEWEKVECLHDRALFLGGNHSMSVSSRVFPECQENSIYFTDDNSYEMSLKYFANDKEGGHDIGVYNLKDKVVEPLPGHQFFDKWTIYDPLPFWIFPNPWPSTVSYNAASPSLSGPRP